MTADTRPFKKIAVIGAGAAGLAQAKQLLQAFEFGSGSPFRLHLVVFEAKSQVGGVWSVFNMVQA